ncbi:MAG: hypothetical protein LKF82_06915 [Acinetobacter populi]|jgi:hypothetical protein|uniref:hypothetical protein n=1 Tax=Acinetobacter populi TaxID=1582270 RepID=UPI002353DB78|nr:hypothetical protein [Acinetobacter populi]MCH4247556.1 hypothetical protein [Acinetobacter populi]
MNKKYGVIALVGIALLITACSREPSQQELQTLYQAKVNHTNQLASKIMQQKGDIIEVKSFEKIDCNAIEQSKDYQCRAKVTLSLPFLGEQQNTADLRVSKGENGWVIID